MHAGMPGMPSPSGLFALGARVLECRTPCWEAQARIYMQTPPPRVVLQITTIRNMQVPAAPIPPPPRACTPCHCHLPLAGRRQALLPGARRVRPPLLGARSRAVRGVPLRSHPAAVWAGRAAAGQGRAGARVMTHNAQCGTVPYRTVHASVAPPPSGCLEANPLFPAAGSLSPQPRSPAALRSACPDRAACRRCRCPPGTSSTATCSAAARARPWSACSSTARWARPHRGWGGVGWGAARGTAGAGAGHGLGEHVAIRQSAAAAARLLAG